MTEVFSIYMI